MRLLISFLSGIFLSQIISTGIVYHSDIQLYQKLTAISEAGYLPIPNRKIMPALLSADPAFFGGLFFTFTVGMFLTILTCLAVFIRTQIKKRYIADIIFAMIWGFGILALNKDGFCPEASLFAVLIPPVVAVLSVLKKQNHHADKPPVSVIAAASLYIVFLLILITGVSQSGIRIFSGFRDYFLLSHPVGIFGNRLYYDYTLYPAEVFKPLKQKQLKTCRLEAVQDEHLAKRLEQTLIRFDYLTVSDAAASDLTVIQEGNRLLFKYGNEIILTGDPDSFLRNPRKILSEYSDKTDTCDMFRKLTFAGLVINITLMIYMVIFLTAYAAYRIFFKSETPAFFFICLSGVMIIGMTGAYFHFRHYGVNPSDLSDSLASGDWKQRVAALEIIRENKMEIDQFANWTRIAESPHIPERYWLAKVLPYSQSPDAYPFIMKLLDDPNFNVVYCAFEALGKRGDAGAADDILKRIRESDHWYTQWYAYRALRQLGWKQNKQ